MAKPARPYKPVVVTANDLGSGAVVFRHRDGTWSIDVAHAEVAEDPEAAADLLARGQADAQACLVVEPVLIEVVRDGDVVRPAALRELIRASGPTVPLPPEAFAHL
ncbi:DUF2849 domain-containing protein [Phreatobacter aquaticus]|uniref:DUF2849 domain-containing protein n=1 Tax=Phreatobacter aquaticus TaxID=2570229 RepID=A0A4D7QMK1_9HYPH|nr:DUF2849 domain-containing protein [Phreatobacter aquaticus]QCK85432.1 DUF2849 domain-containing protein [Phreatobacter aquaticus]